MPNALNGGGIPLLTLLAGVEQCHTPTVGFWVVPQPKTKAIVVYFVPGFC